MKNNTHIIMETLQVCRGRVEKLLGEHIEASIFVAGKIVHNKRTDYYVQWLKELDSVLNMTVITNKKRECKCQG